MLFFFFSHSKYVMVNHVNFGKNDNVEHWDYDITGIMPHMGEHTTQVKAVADIKNRKLSIYMVSLYGLIQSKLNN